MVGAGQVVNQNAYGVDFRLETVYKSDAWDWMATLDLDALTGSASPTTAQAGTLGVYQQPYLSVVHVPAHTYLSVNTGGSLITEWDTGLTQDEGGLDWGDVSDKATIPSAGQFHVSATFVVEDGNNNIVGLAFVGNGLRITTAEIEVNAGVQSQLVVDAVVEFSAGDLVWVELYSDQPGGVDVIVHTGTAQIRSQWVT